VDSFANLSTFPRCGLLRRGGLRRRLWYAALLRLVLRSVRRRGTRIIGWSRTAFAIEQRERRQAPIEHENQTTSVDLRDFPAADIVADLHARDLCRTRTNDGARAFAVYYNTEQRHVRWRRRRRRLGHALDRRRRRRGRPAARREQRAITSRRKVLQRLRVQRIGESTGRLILGLRARTSREQPG